jgi:hypothetical protein
MIERSFDITKMQEAFKLTPGRNEGIDCQAWLDSPGNIMWVEGDNVGLATFEYPGVYNAHWFFNVRGRQALALAKAMLDHHFKETDARTIRGLTPVEYKGARWLARQIGMKSYGELEFPDGPYEMFFLTREDFYKEQ